MSLVEAMEQMMEYSNIKMNLAPHGIRDFYIGRIIFDHKAYQRLMDIRSGGNIDLEKVD